MLLNHAQAEAVYAAMVAANNVDGVVTVVMPCGYAGTMQCVVRVSQDLSSGPVYIYKTGVFAKTEAHLSQAAFARTYKLQGENNG